MEETDKYRSATTIITYNGHTIIYTEEQQPQEQPQEHQEPQFQQSQEQQEESSDGLIDIDIGDEAISLYSYIGSDEIYSEEEEQLLLGEKDFEENLEFIDEITTEDDLYVIDNYSDTLSTYEIVNDSGVKPIKNRYRKQTWLEYFRKLYMVSVILIISIVIYFYYYYSKRKENITSKL